jgi:hypothetical protein
LDVDGLGVAELGGLLLLLGVGLAASLGVSIVHWLWARGLARKRRRFQLQRGSKTGNRHHGGGQQSQQSSGSGRHRTSNAVSRRNPKRDSVSGCRHVEHRGTST